MACQVLSMGLAVLGIRIAFYTGDTTPLTQNSWDWQAGSPAHRRPAASGVGIEVAEVVPFRGHLSVTKEGVLTSTRDGYTSIVNSWKAALRRQAAAGAQAQRRAASPGGTPEAVWQDGQQLGERAARGACACLARQAVARQPGCRGAERTLAACQLIRSPRSRGDPGRHGTRRRWRTTAFKSFSAVRTGESFGLRWPDVDLPEM